MSITKHGIPGIGLGSVALVLTQLGLVFGADGPKQTIDAGGLSFQVPTAWKSSPPTSSMRRAELKVAPAEGDSEPAELVVFAFAGGGGSVEDNVKRWQSQFKGADGGAARVESKTVPGKNVTVTRVEIAGHYFPSQFPGRPKEPDRPNYRLLAAIVQTADTGYFLKMTGPEKTMQASRADFDQMTASLTATSK